MVVNGKHIASRIYQNIKDEVTTLGYTPTVTIITCVPTFETRKYLFLKEKYAQEVGIQTVVIELPPQSTTETVIDAITHAIPTSDGILVQLPLPEHINRDRVISAIPTSHDVDALNQKTLRPLSPVVGAIAEILTQYHIPVSGAFVAILGSGMLVGIPAYQWFVSQGAHVSVVTREVEDISSYTKNADIVVCGTGVPSILKPEMVREGVVILDAGTSEDGGVLRGDADPLCAEKSSLFTPVPGGIGPITIAILLKNVVHCAKRLRGVI